MQHAVQLGGVEPDQAVDQTAGRRLIAQARRRPQSVDRTAEGGPVTSAGELGEAGRSDGQDHGVGAIADIQAGVSRQARGKAKADGAAQRYSVDANAIVLGYDGAVGANLTVGGAFAYGAWRSGPLYVNGLFGYGRRPVQGRAFGRLVHRRRGLVVQAGRPDRTAWTARAGARLSTTWSSGERSVSPYASVFLTRELSDRQTTFDPSLQGEAFQIRSPSVDRTGVRLGAGVTAQASARVQLQAGYRYDDADGASRQSVTGGGMVRW